MRNRIMGRRKFTQLLKDGYDVIYNGNSARAQKGDVIRIVEVEDDTNNQTGRFCGVVVQKSVNCKDNLPNNHGEILTVKRLPVICPKSTIDDIWPQGYLPCGTARPITNVSSCACQR